MSTNIISRESAEQQLNLFLEYYDIVKEDIKDESQENSLSQTCNILIRAIMRGALEISEDSDGLKVIQHLEKTKFEVLDIEYKVCGGATKLYAVEKSKGDNAKAIYLLMGSLSNLGYETMKKFKATDSKVLENLGLLFLLS